MNAHSRPDVLADAIASDEAGLEDDLKVPYAAALYYFARIGGVREQEERTIEGLARDRGIDDGALSVARRVGLDKERLRVLLTRVDGAYLVRDALRIAHADGVLAEDERRVVTKLAEATGLSPARLAWIHSWVEREQAMREEWGEIVAAR